MMYATRSRLVTAVTVALCGSAAFVVSPNVAWASSYSVQGNSGGFFLSIRIMRDGMTGMIGLLSRMR